MADLNAKPADSPLPLLIRPMRDGDAEAVIGLVRELQAAEATAKKTRKPKRRR